MKYIYAGTLVVSVIFIILNLISIFYYKVGYYKKENKNKVYNKEYEFLEIEKVLKDDEINSFDIRINLKRLSNKVLFLIIAVILFFIPILNVLIYGLLFLIIFREKIREYYNL